jgi:putative spermidine/putrescine transport system substrate-binding protein
MTVRPRLRILGRSEILLEPIRRRAAEELGVDLVFQLSDTIDGLRQAVTRPDSFDVYHQWHTMDLVWTARTVQAIDLGRIAAGGEIKGMVSPSTGREIPTLWGSLFVQPDGTLSPKASDSISMLPSIHGVDAFGYLSTLRSSLREGEQDSWGWLLDPRWHGRVAMMRDPVLGMIEAALATEAVEGVVFDLVGNLSIEEIDRVGDLLLRKKKTGHFRGTWSNYEEAAQLMEKGGVVLQSMFSPAFTQLRRTGLPVISSVPAEGYRGWHADLCISAHASGAVLDAAYQYLNWWMSGWPGAVLSRQGYYATLPDSARLHLTPAEWRYWYEGQPAEAPLCDPFGVVCIAPGEVRAGGSHAQRLSRVRVWNSFMDEHTYLVRRWNEFLEA